MRITKQVNQQKWKLKQNKKSKERNQGFEQRTSIYKITIFEI